jgi:hypothetical protein
MVGHIKGHDIHIKILENQPVGSEVIAGINTDS